MISLIIVFLVCCFACTGKRDVLVKDVFKTDPETGEMYPGEPCGDCECSDFCYGYVNEKYSSLPKNQNPVCESGSVEEWKSLGFSIRKACDLCEDPHDCENCPDKDVVVNEADCYSCPLEDICAGKREAKTADYPDLICGFCSTEE